MKTRVNFDVVSSSPEFAAPAYALMDLDVWVDRIDAVTAAIARKNRAEVRRVDAGYEVSAHGEPCRVLYDVTVIRARRIVARATVSLPVESDAENG